MPTTVIYGLPTDLDGYDPGGLLSPEEVEAGIASILRVAEEVAREWYGEGADFEWRSCSSSLNRGERTVVEPENPEEWRDGEWERFDAEVWERWTALGEEAFRTEA